MDLFAAEIGMDPAEVRRINLIPKFLDSHTTTIGQTYDVGDYETALDKALDAAGYTELRAEQARRRESRRRQAARHRRERLRRDHRRRPAGRRQRQDRGARRRLGHRVHRHVTARSGPRHRVVDDHHRADRHPDGPHHARVGRHRPRARRRRHDGFAFAPARRLGGQPGRARNSSTKATQLAASLLEADEADVVLDKDAGAFHVAGTPAVSKTWAELAAASAGRRSADRSTPSTAAAAPRSRSAATSPSSRSTPTPVR